MSSKQKGGPLLVRRTPSHAVVLMLKPSPDGIAWSNLVKYQGDLPYLEDLKEDTMSSIAELRTIVKDRMRIKPEVLFKEHMVLSPDEQLAVEAYFTQLHGDLAEDAVICAQYIDGWMWVYLLGMQPTEGLVVSNYCLTMPTYDERNKRQERTYWHVQFNGSFVAC